jgi:hypothetical protein
MHDPQRFRVSPMPRGSQRGNTRILKKDVRRVIRRRED